MESVKKKKEKKRKKKKKKENAPNNLYDPADFLSTRSIYHYTSLIIDSPKNGP